MSAAALTKRPAGTISRLRSLGGAVASAVLGLAPHILHHVGPLAGAALFAGVGGSLLFGAIGLVAAVPFLLRVHRRSGSWRRPLALISLFGAVFALSTFVVGPAIAGDDEAVLRSVPGHTEHHE